MICSFQCIGFTGLLLNSFLILTIRTDAETPILWPRDVKSWLIGKDPDAGKDWAGGEGDNRGWDGWMASLSQWAWVWVNTRRWWWTGRPEVLQSIGSQRVRHNWVTELNWTEVLGLNITWMMGLLLMDPLKDRWGICFRIVVGQRLSALVSDVFSFRGKVQVSTWNPRAHVLLHLQVTLKNYIF